MATVVVMVDGRAVRLRGAVTRDGVKVWSREGKVSAAETIRRSLEGKAAREFATAYPEYGVMAWRKDKARAARRQARSAPENAASIARSEYCNFRYEGRHGGRGRKSRRLERLGDPRA